MEKLDTDHNQLEVEERWDDLVGQLPISKKSLSAQTQDSGTMADKIYQDVEEQKIMIRSEELKCNEDILCIWGIKMPTDYTEAEKVIHHTLLVVDNMATKEKFRIAYFHSDVSGKGARIPKLIKTIWGAMSKTMRRKLKSFDIIHPTFALKCSLFFFDKFSFKDYKIHFWHRLDNFYDDIDVEQKTFIMGTLLPEIRLYEAQKGKSLMSVNSDKKIFTKVVVTKGDSKYIDFDASKAVQTYQILGKHIMEFPRGEDETVPEIFTLIFNYFEENEEFIKQEGVFRLAGNKETLSKVEENMYEGNYQYLGTVEDPLTVGVFLKKILREMGEPLCTYDLYIQFKDINDENWATEEDKMIMAKKVIQKLPIVNRETFKALLKFLYMFSRYEEYNKMKAYNLSLVFAPNIFRPYEITPNDMIYSQILVKTLTLMIENWGQNT